MFTGLDTLWVSADCWTSWHDLNLSVDKILFDAYGDRFRPSPVLQRFVDSGELGRKTGKGFYEYDKK